MTGFSPVYTITLADADKVPSPTLLLCTDGETDVVITEYPLNALIWTDDDSLGPLHVHTASGDERLEGLGEGGVTPDQAGQPGAAQHRVRRHAMHFACRRRHHGHLRAVT